MCVCECVLERENQGSIKSPLVSTPVLKISLVKSLTGAIIVRTSQHRIETAIQSGSGGPGLIV